MDFKKHIASIPNFPNANVTFRDISPLIKNNRVFFALVKEMVRIIPPNLKFDFVAGVESRGFIFGTAVALVLDKGFIMIRKPGHLPTKTLQTKFKSEYGQGVLEISVNSISAGERILIVDDLLATAGTAKAMINLIETLGGQVVGLLFAINLNILPKNSAFCKKHKVYTVVNY